MEFIIIACIMAIIIYLCVRGWYIALEDQLYKGAEKYAEEKFNDYVNNAQYVVHFKNVGVIDEMNKEE